MIRKILVVLLLALSFQMVHLRGAMAQSGAGAIAAVVNEDAITISDVEDRVTLIVRSSGMPDTPDIREKLRPQILDTLVEEQLQLQEAKRLEQEVTEEELEQGFAQLAQQNNKPPEEFKEMLQRGGINIGTLHRQIRSQMGWGKVIQKNIRPRITVTDADVDDGLGRMRANIGKSEYRVAEISLPVEGVDSVEDVRQLAQRLSDDIRAGKVPFFRVAQQFSKSAGASTGGDLGWVQQGQLDPALEAALASMEVNTVSQPVRTQTGYNLIFLREKRSISEENMPSREGMTETIGIQRLERMQRRQLQDLKASAFIEHRV